MTIVDRYFAKRMITLLIQSLIGFVFLYVFIDLLTHRDLDIIRYDVPWTVVLTYYISFSPQIVFQVAPFALLVSVLLVIGNAAQHNEITAMLAGGVSLRRLIRTPVCIALAFSASLLAVQETIGASALRRSAEIEDVYFSTNPNLDRPGISWANLSGGWTCHINKFNRIALTGEDVIMHLHTEESVEQIEARRVYWDEDALAWFLEDGVWLEFDADVAVMKPTAIRQQVAPIKETPDDLFAMEQSASTKTAFELASDIASARDRAVPTSAMQVAYHVKFAQPALSFVMVFLAIPFAVRLQRGGLAVSFGTSIVIAMIYIVVFAVSVSLGQAERLAPMAAAWTPNALFLAVGLVLFWRTPT
jgi:lipopolysaccharide export system permease protein